MCGFVSGWGTAVYLVERRSGAVCGDSGGGCAIVISRAGERGDVQLLAKAREGGAPLLDYECADGALAREAQIAIVVPGAGSCDFGEHLYDFGLARDLGRVGDGQWIGGAQPGLALHRGIACRGFRAAGVQSLVAGADVKKSEWWRRAALLILVAGV